MRKFLGLAAMAVLVVSMVGGSASATDFPAACGTTGTAFQANSATAGAIAPGTVVKHKLVVPTGQFAQIVMEAGGDADMSVCKSGTSTVGCYSHNMVPVPDACADEGFEGTQGFGPALGAGTWIIRINHCTDIGCGYPADSPAPIPYVLANVVA